ncbi:hypothetical protein [Paracoccus salsus]|uniref:hypothetical protein n=1 Tax=Paracoccus salsus TaxID=2911061 RepID=UPI001F23CA8D|nr:hypothetical protein [Paracoccus salsus]MCF3972947.1 hypothetical protein [Paracoccus salsus]
MPLDAPYQQLMRLLSVRALEWVRQRVMDLPDPIAPDHPAIGALAGAGLVAPALSGFRGCTSPLEEIASRRMTLPLVQAASEAVLAGRGGSAHRELVVAGRLVAGDDPLWQMARRALTDDTTANVHDRLATRSRDDAGLMEQAEAVVRRPIPDEVVCAAAIDSFARVLMQLYRFGEQRPRLSHPRIYGEAFAKALRFADWARHRGDVTAMSQMVFCLRLIDPGHDVTELMAEVIASQRPDGSFPCKTGYSTADQDFRTGAVPTLAALAALHIAQTGGWQPVRRGARQDRPLSAALSRFVTAILPSADAWCAGLDPDDCLDLAAGLTRVTGENWFLRGGLRRHPVRRDRLARLALAVFPDLNATRLARDMLDINGGWPAGWRADPALRALRGLPVTLGDAADVALLARWSQAAARNDPAEFDLCCQQALLFRNGRDCDSLHAAALKYAHQAVLSAETPQGIAPRDAAAHLCRLSRAAQLFEADPMLVAAA